MKVCSKCQRAKGLTGFYVRHTGERAGQYYNHCKECLKVRGKEYYHKNHVRQLALAVKRRRKYRKDLREFVDILKNKPCTDCGQVFPPYVMDFDHRRGEIKIGNVGTLISQTRFTKAKLIEEISKCDLVCANCHRIRTFK